MPKSKKSKSSKKWLVEHFRDSYVKRAKQQGFRARSVYKLMEIQKQYKLIKPGMIVVDLGAAPGSWSAYVIQLIGRNGKVIAIDILPIQPISGVTFVQGDVTSEDIVAKFFKYIGDQKVDVVISDMAPNISGIAAVDQARMEILLETASNFATRVLKLNGTLLIKTFQGGNFKDMLTLLRSKFRDVKVLKPSASRARSAEIFLLAKGFKLK